MIAGIDLRLKIENDFENLKHWKVAELIRRVPLCEQLFVAVIWDTDKNKGRKSKLMGPSYQEIL